jgi:hypothetical protein
MGLLHLYLCTKYMGAFVRLFEGGTKGLILSMLASCYSSITALLPVTINKPLHLSEASWCICFNNLFLLTQGCLFQ